MTAEQLDIDLLQNFSPLDGLKRDNLAALAKKVRIRELSPQQVLFKEGDTEKRTIYILSGGLELLDQGKIAQVVEGGTASARNPVSPHFPENLPPERTTAFNTYQSTAICLTSCSPGIRPDRMRCLSYRERVTMAAATTG